MSAERAPGAPIVVLGGGCAGLAAARRLRELGRAVTLVEAADHVGGLAGGVRLGGNVYEYGPHIFHTTDPFIMADVKALMGPELVPYERTISIRFLGGYFSFPLSVSDVLRKLPLTTVLHAGLSFAWHFLKGLVVKPAVENTETVLRRYYGDVLYRLFFKDYIERVWGVPPSSFSPAFARERIPRLNFVALVDKAAESLKRALGLRREVSTSGYVEKVEGELWTTRRGFSLICDRMAEDLVRKGGVLRLNAKAVGLRRDGGRVAAVELEGGESLPCAGVVNTLAINEAPFLLKPGLGEDVESAAKALRFRAIVFVGLKVRRPQVLRASFMYFREHSFNRITDLSYFAFDIEPKGTTLLVAEITCDPSDRIWSDDALAVGSVLADLEREGILKADEVLEKNVFRTRHGQPMYLLGYEAALKTVLDAFETVPNAVTAGRQGRFAYVNTHVAMKMGREAADRLAAKSPAV